VPRVLSGAHLPLPRHPPQPFAVFVLPRRFVEAAALVELPVPRGAAHQPPGGPGAAARRAPCWDAAGPPGRSRVPPLPGALQPSLGPAGRGLSRGAPVKALLAKDPLAAQGAAGVVGRPLLDAHPAEDVPAGQSADGVHDVVQADGAPLLAGLHRPDPRLAPRVGSRLLAHGCGCPGAVGLQGWIWSPKDDGFAGGCLLRSSRQPLRLHSQIARKTPLSHALARSQCLVLPQEDAHTSRVASKTQRRLGPLAICRHPAHCEVTG